MGNDDADAARYEHQARDAALVERVRAGDDRAFGELYDFWFDRVHDVAMRIVRDAGLAGEVVQETFLAAWRKLDSLNDVGAFGGWLLRIARNRSLNLIEKERRSAPVDDVAFAAIEAKDAAVSAPVGFAVEQRLTRADDPALAAEDAEVGALLWDAAGALGERDLTVINLLLRHELSPAEIGEVVGVNRNAANQLVHRVKKRLDSAVSARVLWNGPIPACDLLADELSAAGVSEFGPAAVKVASRHVDHCDSCAERQESRLAPHALFAAVPVIVAPILLKQEVVAALTGAGLPMAGSASIPTGAGTPDGTVGVEPVAESAHRDEGVAGTEGDGSGDEERAGSRTARVLVGAGLLAVVLLVVVALAMNLSGGDPAQTAAGPAVDSGPDTAGPAASASPTEVVGHPATTDVSAPATSSNSETSMPSTTMSSAPSPAAGEPAGPGGPVIVFPPPPPPGPSPPPVAPPQPPPPPPPPPPPAPPTSGLISVAPATHAAIFALTDPGRPVLSWSVSGPPGIAVEVTGPGVASADLTGTAEPCPNVGTGACVGAPGTYVYRLRVWSDGAQTTLLLEQTTLLTLV